MKSVPNLISYIHNFFWNFSQFLAIYFGRFLSRIILIQKTLTNGSHLSDAARYTGPAWQRAVAVWLPCAVPLQRVKSAVGTARRLPDSAVPTAPPALSAPPRAASPRPSRQRSSRPRRRPVRRQPSLFERPDRRCPAASAVASTPTVSEAEPPLVVFIRGASSSPPLPPPHRRTAAGHRSPTSSEKRRRRAGFLTLTVD
jgi:hypothetical protein